MFIYLYRRGLEFLHSILESTNQGVTWDNSRFSHVWVILPIDEEWKHKSEYGITQSRCTTVANPIAEAVRDCITRAAYVSWWKWDVC